MKVDISLIQLILGTIVFMAVGYYWYGKLFGELWQKLTKVSTDKVTKKQMQKSMTVAIACGFVLNFVYQHVAQMSSYSFGQGKFITGFQTAFWMWFGFVLLIMLMNNVYEQKPKKLTLINSGYILTCLIIYGLLYSIF